MLRQDRTLPLREAAGALVGEKCGRGKCRPPAEAPRDPSHHHGKHRVSRGRGRFAQRCAASLRLPADTVAGGGVCRGRFVPFHAPRAARHRNGVHHQKALSVQLR
jgi:hypothetical protein